MRPLRPESLPAHSDVMALPARARENIRLTRLVDLPGLVEYPGSRSTSISIHVGPPSRLACRRGCESFRGTLIHGDIDIIPAGMPSSWELKERDTALVLSLDPEFMATVAQDQDVQPDQIHVRNRFKVRDVQIEHIAWALQAEMDRGYPCGRLYLDSLATALAVQLLRHHIWVAGNLAPAKHSLSGRRLKQVLAFIEENLSADLSLKHIADVAGLSLSHCKVLFRQATGLPIHQYLIRRRLERAKWLLRQSNTPISQIALEAGFAHQSHLAMHMRRLMGVSPRAFRRALQ